jgi:hypothetical protein
MIPTRLLGALELGVDHLSGGHHVVDGQQGDQEQVGLGALPPVPWVLRVLCHVRQEQLVLLQPLHCLGCGSKIL